MKLESGLFQIVYEYYETRILYGIYVYGDFLPSIPKMCAIFRMAPATVRSALSLLEKNNYIQIAARTPAKVIYHVEKYQFRKNAIMYFVPRKEAIADLNATAQILIFPLLSAGLRRWSEDNWTLFRHTLIPQTPETAYMPVTFYLLVLSALHNKLVLNLYWELIRYIRLPYIVSKNEHLLNIQTLQGQSKSEIIAHILHDLEKPIPLEIKHLNEFINQAQEDSYYDSIKPIPFQWNIYRKRPQLRYTLTSQIIREIINGKYPIGSYLPSLHQMIQKYGVSRNTVRRTLDILSGLGITESYHGKGTLVNINPLKIDLTIPDIKEGLRLFSESLEILALTIRSVSSFTLEALTEGERKALTERFMLLRKEKRSHLVFDFYLTYLVEYCPATIVRECYGKIQELLIWGYPFTLLRLKHSNLHEVFSDITAQIEGALVEGNIEKFSEIWETLLIQEEQNYMEYIEEMREC